MPSMDLTLFKRESRDNCYENSKTYVYYLASKWCIVGLLNDRYN